MRFVRSCGARVTRLEPHTRFCPHTAAPGSVSRGPVVPWFRGSVVPWSRGPVFPCPTRAWFRASDPAPMVPQPWFRTPNPAPSFPPGPPFRAPSSRQEVIVARGGDYAYFHLLSQHSPPVVTGEDEFRSCAEPSVVSREGCYAARRGLRWKPADIARRMRRSVSAQSWTICA